MKKILSIAVPAYNAEGTLDKCLSSMLAKECLERLEVIAVDDGSPDLTGVIADRYAARYPGSVSVIHKENGGHGSGINAAAGIARGKYFRVVDADDWLLTENLPAHLAELEACGADVAINGFHRVDMNSGRRVSVEVPAALRGRTVSMEQLAPLLLSVKNCFCIQGITYRSDFYRECGWTLSEKVFYEDSEYCILPFRAVRSICFSSMYLYQYQVGNAQQSISDANQVKRLGDLERVFQTVCRAGPPAGEPSAAAYYMNEKLRGMVTTYLVTCLLRDPDRVRGRGLAEEFLGWIARERPSLLPAAKREYQKIMLLHNLRLSGRALDALLDSALYRIVRNQIRKLR